MIVDLNLSQIGSDAPNATASSTLTQHSRPVKRNSKKLKNLKVGVSEDGNELLSEEI